MESRKITIISSETQQKYVIMSNAEKLIDLKSDLDKEGINYKDMTFMEGITKSEFNDDNAVLPQNVEYRGNKTNELVFMLTKSEKKIKSGMMNIKRIELYEYIKAKNLQDVCLKTYNKNFTQLKTAELEDIVNHHRNSIPHENACASSTSSHEVPPTIEERISILEERVAKLEQALTSDLKDNVIESSYSDAEITNMFKGLE